MYCAGVQLLAGGASLDAYVCIGDSLHKELQWQVRAGLRPLEAFEAATKNPAEFFGDHQQSCRGVKGGLASLVVLDVNHPKEIGNTQKVRAVMLVGCQLSRSDLDAPLARSRPAAAGVNESPRPPLASRAQIGPPRANLVFERN